MATITALWDSSPAATPDQAAIVSLWERSWRKRGWEPKLLTRRKLQARRKGQNPISIYIINFSVRVNTKRAYPVFAWTDPQAKTSACVDFTGATLQQILDFGREI